MYGKWSCSNLAKGLAIQRQTLTTKLINRKCITAEMEGLSPKQPDFGDKPAKINVVTKNRITIVKW